MPITLKQKSVEDMKKGIAAPKEKEADKEEKPAAYKKGGMVAASKMGKVRTAAPSRDGIASKGKTKGKMIVMAGNKRMNKGGKC
jgi:hypothetical protein